MQPTIKVVVAIVVVALIAVIGLIWMTNSRDSGAGEPAAAATTAPEETKQLEETAEPEGSASPDPDDADDEAQNEAQGAMYEGALAGLSEEEIAALAIAGEGSSARTDNLMGAEGAVD